MMNRLALATGVVLVTLSGSEAQARQCAPVGDDGRNVQVRKASCKTARAIIVKARSWETNRSGSIHYGEGRYAAWTCYYRSGRKLRVTCTARGGKRARWEIPTG